MDGNTEGNLLKPVLPVGTFKGFLVEVAATGRTYLLAGKEPVGTVRMQE